MAQQLDFFNAGGTTPEGFRFEREIITPEFERTLLTWWCSSCRFRLRRRVAGKWIHVTLDAEPRSAYLLSGAARTEWEHSIPPVDALRYSITYRNIR